MTANNPKFLYTHFVYPLVVLVMLSAVINFFDVDKVVADYFYNLQGHSWAWKNSWLAEGVLHKGGRNVSFLFALMVLVLLVKSHYCNRWVDARRPLTYLMFAAAGGGLLVSLFKFALAVSCPWDFERYGGHLIYHPVIEQLMLRNGDGCFPAGHASAGYAWVALYFVGLGYNSRLRWLGLALPVAAGLVFGVAQQIRGAHFISHDLWTFAVCWFYSLALYVLIFRGYPAQKCVPNGLMDISNPSRL